MSARETAPWLKVAVVMIAVALGGVYVGWKARGAGHGETPVDPAEKTAGPTDYALIVGSKSPGRDVIDLSDPHVFNNEAANQNPTQLMPSSKSIRLIPPVGETPSGEPILLIPSSKSARILPPADEEKPPGPRPVFSGSKSKVPIFDQDKDQQP